MNRSGLLELNAVVAVAQHRSFRRAATELQVSPSAVSHAVAALEQRMGVRLFHRTTRSVSLSEAGEQFLARIDPALREIAAAMESANRFRETPRGTLRINTSEGAAQMTLRPIMLTFLQRYPDMQLELVTDDALVDIVADGFDAGIRLFESVPQDMIALPFTPPLRLAAVASPSYLAGRSIPTVPTDLLQHLCIRRRFPGGTLFKWEFEKDGQHEVVDMPGQLTLNSQALTLQAALEGAGIAVLGEFAVAPHLASGKLVRLLDDWMPSYPGLALFYPANRHPSAGMKAFIEVVREFARETPTDAPPASSPVRIREWLDPAG
ncbi:LysR family transcriptional regulator [Pseudomonas sp. D(2018)]|uniref:LysR family transcriptional regulator n=1 Tax=Pseudomonadaceae TaxID=135621 RepID=UPI0010F80C40|nr:LysR family transcriptional regulator [Pseudomonas sp. D(2018)]